LQVFILNFVRLFYEKIKQQASTFDEFVDLSAILVGNNRSDFRDLCHTSPYAQNDVAYALANFIISIEKKSLQSN
jgi:ABC-type transport system involved in Fe-S cluster assembly fused permease/ATPase subunit